MELNEVDLKILQQMTAQERITWAELANGLELSAPAAADRVRRLEEKGVIQGYTARLNPEAIVLVLGVFLGSALWWLLLCGSVSLFRIRLNAQTLSWLNRISGLVLLTFGIIALSLRSQ